MAILYGGENDQKTAAPSSDANGSSTRKVVGDDLTKNWDNTSPQLALNSDHLLETAFSLKLSSVAAKQIGAQARGALKTTRDLLTGVDPSGKSSKDIAPQGNLLFLDQSQRASQMADQFVLTIGSSPQRANSFALDLVAKSYKDIFKTKSPPVRSSAVNDVVPMVKNIAVDIDPKKGSVDFFFARMTFLIPKQKVLSSQLKLIRIMRSVTLNPTFSRNTGRLSLRGVERIRSSKNRFRSKTNDSLSQFETRLAQSSVQNVITSTLMIDPATGLRRSSGDVAGISDPTVTVNVSGQADIAGYVQNKAISIGDALAAADRSVATDPVVVANIQNQVKDQRNISQTSVTVGNQPQQVPASTSGFSLDFQEVAAISFDKLKAVEVGDYLQYTWDDDSIVYGRGYTFYVSTVDANMNESLRSELVNIVVDGYRTPPAPKSVYASKLRSTVTLNIVSDDQLIEKFEVFRKSEVPADLTIPALVVSSPDGMPIQSTPRIQIENGFTFIGEALNGSIGSGGSFLDRDIIPGRRYTYRVFAVDVFGNKSETPRELSFFHSDPSKITDLGRPRITAEVDATTGKVLLTFGCVDTRIERFVLARRDLTLSQLAFTAPADANRVIIGNVSAARGQASLESEKFHDTVDAKAWTGFFENDGSEQKFIDRTTVHDHTYQYKIFGLDRLGNMSSAVFSKPLFVPLREMVDRPRNVIATALQGPQFTVGGVRLNWTDGTLVESPEVKLGSQRARADTAVKTLFQIERLKQGDDRWLQFPLIDGTSFQDLTATVAGSDQLNFRPPWVEENTFYTYRIRAVQSGTFISNYSDNVDVFAGLPVTTPVDFRAIPGDTKVTPLNIVLNWNTPNNSGIVDSWEIQRAVVNNFAAVKLSIADQSSFSSLAFQPFRMVSRESSRSRSIALEQVQASSQVGSEQIVADHYFKDTDISLGNTYIYRIRATGLDQRNSDWVSKAVKMTDASFELTLPSLVSPAETQSLISNFLPMEIKGTVDQTTNSLSMDPDFTRSAIPSAAEAIAFAPPPVQLPVQLRTQLSVAPVQPSSLFTLPAITPTIITKR